MKEERFKSLFAAFGTVTDCSLKFTKDGKFRKFGFVGFKSEEDATRALQHFNKSFVDTSRVTVRAGAGGVGVLPRLQRCARHGRTSRCEPRVFHSSRWRCVKTLETPQRPEPGANTARAPERRSPPPPLLLLPLQLQMQTAKRYKHVFTPIF